MILSYVHPGFLPSSVVLENTSFKCGSQPKIIAFNNVILSCAGPVHGKRFLRYCRAIENIFIKYRPHTQRERRKSRVRSSSDESGKGWEKGRHSQKQKKKEKQSGIDIELRKKEGRERTKVEKGRNRGRRAGGFEERQYADDKMRFSILAWKILWRYSPFVQTDESIIFADYINIKHQPIPRKIEYAISLENYFTISANASPNTRITRSV